MIQHTLENGKTLLFVEVPEDAVDFAIEDYYISFKASLQRGLKQYMKCSIPPGNWQLLGDSREITEEQLNLLGITTEAYASLKQMLGVVDVNPFAEPDGYLEWHAAQQQVKRYVLLINQQSCSA